MVWVKVMPCRGKIMLTLMVISILWGNTTIQFWLEVVNILSQNTKHYISTWLLTAQVTQTFSSNRISMLRNDHIKHQICILFNIHLGWVGSLCAQKTSNTKKNFDRLQYTIGLLKAIMSQTIVSLRCRLQAIIKVNIGHIMNIKPVLNIDINCILKDKCVVRCVS
jgi:hypothetical protein